MSQEFCGDGNLGDTPAVKYVSTKDGERQVAELSIYFDKYKPGRDGTFERIGGFWLTGSVWGEQADDCAKLLRKGTRVHVVGELKEETWTDKTTGQEKSALRLKIDRVYLALARIETVQFKPKRSQQEPEFNDADGFYEPA